MLNLLNRIKPGTFFIFAALFLELLFNLFTPPLQAPDELNHFYRAYQIADGHFLPERTKDRLGGQMPVCFNEFVLSYNFTASNLKYTFDKKDILKPFTIPFSGKETEFKDFPSTTTYSAISYLPQVTGLFIIKHFNCSVGTLYYTGRLFGFLFWLVIMFLVIKIVPVYKWLFTLIILLPMNLYVANAFSADGVNNCLTFLFIALVLRHIFSEAAITKKDILVILLILVFLAIAKFVYVSFIILMLLIPAKKFSSQLYRFGSMGFILACTLVVVSLWSGIYLKNYIKISEYNQEYIYNIGLSPCADYKEQKAYILNHGFYFFKVIYHSVFDHPQTYLKGYVGAFGQADIPLPNWLYSLIYALILFVAITERNKIAFTLKQKVTFLIAAFSAFVLILLSIHLMWDCVGEGVVDLVQGRYLIPIFPLIFMLFSNRKFQLNYSPVVLMLPILLLTYLFSAKVIYTRFFKESFSEKIEFYCDAETKGDDGVFKTNNPYINLTGANLQTNAEHRSGNYSALLSPENPYCFSFYFKNLQQGDLIEMEGWQKGQGGSLALSAKGKGCTDYFASSKQIVLKDKNGWQKIHVVLTITENCNFPEAAFFVWNPGKTNVYFDDLRFSIKKYKNHYLN